MLTPEQIRMARSALKWSVREVATKCGLMPTTVNLIENGKTDPRASTLKAIQDAFEKAGIVFIAENGGGPGVRLRKKRRV